MPIEKTETGVLLSVPNACCEIRYFGATIIDWTVSGTQKIFLSKAATLGGPKAIRGGIPLVFPHFGKVATSPLPQHGFARVSVWDFETIDTDHPSQATVSFSLSPKNVSKDYQGMWAFKGDWKVVYTVSLTPSSLETKFTVRNTSSSQNMVFTCLLHTYLTIKVCVSFQVYGRRRLTPTRV